MSQAKKFYKTTLCYLASACVLAFLWLVKRWAVQLFYFFYAMAFVFGKKINVLHCSVSKRQKKCVGWRQHRRRLVCCGFCVLAQA